MATPVIDSIAASPNNVPPGGAFVVSIVAHDPDSLSGRLTGRVVDSAGNSVDATVDIQINDVLSYVLLDSDNVGFTITPRAGQPGVFDCVAP